MPSPLIDHATIYFEVALPPALDAAARAMLRDEFTAKLQRMDPTGIHAGWTFPIGPADPSPTEQITAMNQHLALLAGDEQAKAIMPTATSGVFYCNLQHAIICYQWGMLVRTAPSGDRNWGGPLGANSDIAFIQDTYCMPLMAVYAFGRAL